MTSTYRRNSIHFLQVMSVSILASFLFSIVVAFNGYVPISDRNPNVYHFSITELFLYFFFTTILISIAIGFLSFFLYLLLRRLLSVRTWWLKLVSLIGAMVFVWVYYIIFYN
ncbi:hypothetical protein N782_01910 [Pontibacillus yanchengensis Y32]|uniref:Uncharacterized protein n=1 Tax=Pontibacillus yanchengensis Y32 TaxID=1385514 RepID=A0A0A2T9B4_9BACI|nr:hypothetical protein N782_01910 [Pontibacillus yanchengensis Y32]